MTAINTNIQSGPVLSSPGVSVPTSRQPTVQAAPVPQAASTASPAHPAAVQGEQPSLKDVQKAVDQANAALENSNHAITFGYEEKLGQLIVQVSDKATGQVIQQLPSKDFIQHQIFMKEMVGLLLDRQA